MGKVAAIVVTYNRKDLLKECLEALLANTGKECDVLVIDNASDDGTKEHIKKMVDNKKVFYFNTGKNIGGAGGFNYGMKKAYDLGYDFMWLMDDDCIVQESSLSELLKAHKRLNGNYGFLSSKVLWKDGSLCQMNKQKKTLSKKMKDFETNFQQIQLATFVSFFLKSETVKKYGLPIKEFFIWGDDLEYSRRISRKEKCYFISTSIVVHKSKNNAGSNIAVAEGDLKRYSYAYRNECVLFRGEGIKGWFLFKIRLLLHKFRILKSEKKDKKERMAIMRNAIKDGKKFRPGIEYVEVLK